MEGKIFLQKDNVRNLSRTQDNFRNIPKYKMTSTYIEVRLQVLDQLWTSVVLTHNLIVENLDTKWKEDAACLYGKAEEIYLDCKREMEQMPVNGVSLSLEDQRKETYDIILQNKEHLERDSEYYATLFKRVMMSSKQRTIAENTSIIEKTNGKSNNQDHKTVQLAKEIKSSIGFPFDVSVRNEKITATEQKMGKNADLQGKNEIHEADHLVARDRCNVATEIFQPMQNLKTKVTTKADGETLTFASMPVVRVTEFEICQVLNWVVEKEVNLIAERSVSRKCLSLKKYRRDLFVVLHWLNRKPKRWKL